MSDAGPGISVVVHLEVRDTEQAPGVAGRLECEPFGERCFTGWLGLLCELEAMVEAAAAPSNGGPTAE